MVIVHSNKQLGPQEEYQVSGVYPNANGSTDSGYLPRVALCKQQIGTTI